MEGYPLAGFADFIVILAAAIVLAILGAVSATAYLLFNRPLPRRAYQAMVSLIVIVNAAFLFMEPAAWVGFVKCSPVGSARQDLPLFALVPAMPYLLVYTLFGPLVRRLVIKRR